jgi:hypothetical protein
MKQIRLRTFAAIHLMVSGMGTLAAEENKNRGCLYDVEIFIHLLKGISPECLPQTIPPEVRGSLPAACGRLTTD